MIVRVVRPGSDMPGLAAYMWGPGKAEEHTEQHMIASTGAGVQRIGDAELFFAGERAVALEGRTLDSGEARSEGRRLEQDWRRFREESKTPVAAGAGVRSAAGQQGPPDAGPDAYRVDPEFTTQKRQELTGWNRPHVFHVTFSLRQDEGKLSDETWGRIASEYVDRMGFAGKDGRAGCEWAAWRHGVSKNGNDHIHVAVSLVKSDGRWANEYRSKVRSRGICDDLEKKYGLRPAKDSSGQRGMPGRSRAEEERHRKEPRGTTPERERVAMVVRRAATRASTEKQFIADVLRQGVRIRPHFKKGGREEVTGASFKERGSDGPWLSGTQCGRDLTLPKLRTMWDDSPQRRAEALPLWQGQKSIPKTQAPPRFEASWNTAQRALAEWATRVERIDPHDQSAWSRAARDAASVASELAQGSGGPQKGHMGALAHELARAAQQRQQPTAQVADNVRVACRHLSLTMRASSRSSAVGWYAVLSQMQRVSRAIHTAQSARGEHVRAARLEASMRSHLTPVIKGAEKARTKTAPPRTPRTRITTRQQGEERER